jgi:hypothetical protein
MLCFFLHEKSTNLSRKLMASASVSQYSAVPGMSVPEVRRALAVLRSRWVQHSPIELLRLSDVLTDDIIVAEFAYRFVLGHHQKRHRRRPDAARSCADAGGL